MKRGLKLTMVLVALILLLFVMGLFLCRIVDIASENETAWQKRTQDRGSIQQLISDQDWKKGGDKE